MRRGHEVLQQKLITRWRHATGAWEFRTEEVPHGVLTASPGSDLQRVHEVILPAENEVNVREDSKASRSATFESTTPKTMEDMAVGALEPRPPQE